MTYNEVAENKIQTNYIVHTYLFDYRRPIVVWTKKNPYADLAVLYRIDNYKSKFYNSTFFSFS